MSAILLRDYEHPSHWLSMAEEDSINNNKYFCQRCKDRNWVIECGCGCKNILLRYNDWCDLRRYIKGHQGKGKHSGSYKGGRTTNGPYWVLLKHGHRLANSYGYVLEHRYLYEQYHNCCLLKWGHVHHKNGNKKDNRKENLEGMTNVQHILHHRPNKKIDMSNRFCLLCNNTKTTIQWHNYTTNVDGHICHRCYMRIYHTNHQRR
jgi:HNH endonuclease